MVTYDIKVYMNYIPENHFLPLIPVNIAKQLIMIQVWENSRPIHLITIKYQQYCLTSHKCVDTCISKQCIPRLRLARCTMLCP